MQLNWNWKTYFHTKIYAKIILVVWSSKHEAEVRSHSKIISILVLPANHLAKITPKHCFLTFSIHDDCLKTSKIQVLVFVRWIFKILSCETLCSRLKLLKMKTWSHLWPLHSLSTRFRLVHEQPTSSFQLKFAIKIERNFSSITSISQQKWRHMISLISLHEHKNTNDGLLVQY